MENNEYDINLTLDLEKLSKFICKQYKLKEYQNSQLIYEDYNNFSFVINCENKKYFVRVFNQHKGEKEIQNFIEKYRTIQSSLKKNPKILKQKSKEILKIILDNNEKIYVMVMEYVEGQSLLQEDIKITREDIDLIVNALNELKSIDYEEEIKNISFTNLKNNLKKYNETIPNKWNEDISMCLDAIKRLNNKEMKKQLIHGDLHLGHIIKNNDKVTLVDFDNFGYSYRLIDVVKIINNVIFTLKDKKLANELYEYFLEVYQKENPLTKTELKNLNVLVIADCYNNLCLNRFLMNNNKKNKSLKYWYKNDLRVIKIFKKKI